MVPTLLCVFQLGERVIQAPAPSIGLAGTRFGFGKNCFESGHKPNKTLLPKNADAPPHLCQPGLALAAQPSCPALTKCRPAGPKGWEIVSRHDVRQRLAVGRDCFRVAPNNPKQRRV